MRTGHGVGPHGWTITTHSLMRPSLALFARPPREYNKELYKNKCCPPTSGVGLRLAGCSVLGCSSTCSGTRASDRFH